MKTIIYRNIKKLLTLQGVAKKEGRHITEADLSIIANAAFVVRNGQFAWIGANQKIPREYFKNSQEVDLQKATVLPGFVECHTHSIFAGSRAAEFEQRNNGISYQEIAAAGGGIISTMQRAREASKAKLIQLAQKRVHEFIRQGVTTLEIKSGYALDLKNELKLLQVIKELGPIEIVATYLGAHALPSEFSSTSEYIQFMIEKVFPALQKKKLAERVDIFIEKGFFSTTDAKKYFSAAKKYGFATTVHADQLSLNGGANIACEFSSLSADHLLQIQDPEIQKLAKSNVTCVLLPAADLYMKCAYPPARKLIQAGARVALATDFNPGSSPTQELSLVGLLARLEMKMTLPEVIAAYTYNAATALNRQKKIGSIELGKSAHFICYNLGWTDLFYSIGSMDPEKIFYNGYRLKNS